MKIPHLRIQIISDYYNSNDYKAVNKKQTVNDRMRNYNYKSEDLASLRIIEQIYKEKIYWIRIVRDCFFIFINSYCVL